MQREALLASPFFRHMRVEELDEIIGFATEKRVSKGGTIFTNPPLCVTEQELAHGFEIIDRALAVTDEVFEA